MSIHFNCPKCGKKVHAAEKAAGRRAKCPGCQHVMAIPGSDVDARKVQPGERGRSPAGSEDVEAHRLVNGYTQIETSFARPAHSTIPILNICVACGAELDQRAAGKSKRLRASFSDGLGSCKLTTKAYLCQRCSTPGFPVSDFIQFHLPSMVGVVIQIGNHEVAKLWIEALKDYCNAVGRAAARTVLGPEIAAAVWSDDQVTWKRYEPDQPGFSPRKGIGCTVALILTAMMVASAAAVVLLATHLLPAA